MILSGPDPLFALVTVVIVVSENPPIFPDNVNVLAPLGAPRLQTM